MKESRLEAAPTGRSYRPARTSHAVKEEASQLLHNSVVVPISNQCQLVIFDCDGVLVDSELITHEVLIDSLSELGLQIDLYEALGLFTGNTLAQTVATIEDRLGRALPEGFFAQWRQRLYAEFEARPVLAVAGIEQLLDGLITPTCVVSNGPFAKMRSTLGVTGLLARFEGRLFSPEMGLAGKPSPDLFLAAAATFSLPSSQVAVVEDSPTGVRGAKRAGMTVFGYAGGSYTDASALESEGAHVFTDMGELLALLNA